MAYELAVDRIIDDVTEDRVDPMGDAAAIDAFLLELSERGYVIVRLSDVRMSMRGMCGGF